MSGRTVVVPGAGGSRWRGNSRGAAGSCPSVLRPARDRPCPRSGRPLLLATRLTAAAGAAAAALVLGGCAGTSSAGGALVVQAQDGDGFHGAKLDSPYAKPDLRFTDVDGGTFDLAKDTTKPVTLVFFGYTNCPDVCSAVLADAASALRRAPAEVRARTQLVFITTDPARDTPHVIRAFLDRFDPSFVGLTAPMQTIEQAAESLGVALTGTEKLPSGGYDVGHGAQLIGWGPGGRTTVVWTPGTTVGALREDLTRLSGEA